MASPPSTTDPITDIDQIAADVEAAYLESKWLRWEALTDPTNEDAAAAALASRTGAAHDSARVEISQFRELNYRAIRSAAVEPRVHAESLPQPVDEHNSVFELTSCVIDSWVVVETAAGPAGSDAVVDDAIYAYRDRVFMELDDGRWKLSGSTEIGTWIGTQSCPAE